MTIPRTLAILRVLARGREPKLGEKVLRIFGATTFEECETSYASLGNAERSALDAALAQMADHAGAAFALGVDNELTRDA